MSSGINCKNSAFNPGGIAIRPKPCTAAPFSSPPFHRQIVLSKKTTMKTTTTLLLVIFSTCVLAQVPNNGFESWENRGTYEDPRDWATLNSIAAPGSSPITRSSDHRAGSPGAYAIRVSNSPSMGAFGLCMTSTDITAGPLPYFPVEGHPLTFEGYYRYQPEGGDTLYILALLYKKGEVVSAAEMLETKSTPAWSRFSLSFSPYQEADSASILLSAYHAAGPPPAFIPHGNSVLLADDLAFGYQTGVHENPALSDMLLIGPVPFHNELKLSPGVSALSLYNSKGQKILLEDFQPGSSVNVSGLPAGIYFGFVTVKGETVGVRLVKE
jgi:hypothetical protein